jgi:hypothetical protein
MAKTVFTLEYASTEKTLADWGLKRPRFKPANQAAGVFTVDQPGAKIDDDPLFAFDQQVIIRSRILAADGTPTGGQTIFQGRRVLAPVEGRPEFEGIRYEFHDVWYDLTITCFQQTYHAWSTDNPPQLVTVAISDLFLMRALDGTRLDTGAQIREVLNWAISEGALLQIGVIDVAVPQWYYEVKEIMCSEAIQNCLRVSPDAVTFLDYSTVPPTFHVRKRANLTPVLLSIDEPGAETSLTPRHDLQVPSVALKYKITSDANGQTLINYAFDFWPLPGTGHGRGALIQTIDLQGFRETNVSSSIVTEPMNANSPDAATRLAWWSGHQEQLASPKTRGVIIGEATITEKINGVDVPVDVSLVPNELKHRGGTLAAWMKLGDGTAVIKKEVTIKAQISYSEWDTDDDGSHTNGIKLKTYAPKEHSVSALLTNGVTGTYSTVSSFTSGDPVPVGIAQMVYESLKELQYDGSHSFYDDSGEIVPGTVGMGNVLNLAGGRPEWATMNAQIQAVEYDFDTGLTTVTVGPAKHLNAGDLTALFLINRFRYTWNNPATRTTGQGGSGGQVDLGAGTPKQDTTHGLGQLQHLAINQPQPGVVLPSGSPAPPAQIINIPQEIINQAPTLPADQRIMQPRKYAVCVQGTPMYAVLHATPTFT